MKTDHLFLLRWFPSKTSVIDSFYCNISASPFTMIHSSESSRTKLLELFKVIVLYNLEQTWIQKVTTTTQIWKRTDLIRYMMILTCKRPSVAGDPEIQSDGLLLGACMHASFV